MVYYQPRVDFSRWFLKLMTAKPDVSVPVFFKNEFTFNPKRIFNTGDFPA